MMRTHSRWFNPLIVLALSLAWPVLARAIETTDSSVKSVLIAENLYLLTGTQGSNVAYLVTEGGVLVVDGGLAPCDGQAIVEAVKKTTPQPIKYVVLTHYHSDHTMGLQSFPPAAIVVAHENTGKSIRDFGPSDLKDLVEQELPAAIERRRLKAEKLRVENDVGAAKAESELATYRGCLAEMKTFRFVYPQVTFSGELEITLGKDVVRLQYPGPAHTDGDILVSFPGKKVIHMGDVFFHYSLPYIDRRAGSDTANWIKQVEQVMATDMEKVIPGHGPLGDRKSLQLQIDYLTALRQAVAEAMKKGSDLPTMQKTIRLPAYEKWEYQEIFPDNIKAVYEEMKGGK